MIVSRNFELACGFGSEFIGVGEVLCGEILGYFLLGEFIWNVEGGHGGTAFGSFP